MTTLKPAAVTRFLSKNGVITMPNRNREGIRVRQDGAGVGVIVVVDIDASSEALRVRDAVMALLATRFEVKGLDDAEMPSISVKNQ